MSLFSNTVGSIPSWEARLFTSVRAACTLSRITSPSWPVRISAPFAGRARGFDEENVAADRRPGKPGRDTRNTGAHGDLAFEPRLAKDTP